jgi:two-component system LytT family response regulator
VQTPIRALIVDDEPLARRRIRALLRADTDITVTGECGNGRDALAAIEAEMPDLLFLDVQMPELDGFGVVQAMEPDRMPIVVFVTAYDEHALKAFEVHALDYLLKPVDRERFRGTVERAKEQVRRAQSADAGQRLDALLATLGDERRAEDRIAIKTGGRVLFVRLDDIDWIETAGNHVRVHAGKDIHQLRDTLGRLEQRLPSRKFLRIHRSTIVNIERIREIQPWFQGDHVLILRDGTRLTSGRSYRERLRAFLDRMS